MMKEKNIFVKYLRHFAVSGIFIFLLFAGVSIAINTTEEGYKVNFSESKEITAHSVCKQVTNNHNSSLDIFVPTKISEEWSSFLSFPPPGVTIAECGPCSGPPPYASGYSLNNFIRQYSSYGEVPWVSLITNDSVVSGADRTGAVYSSSQGNWLPTNTYTKTLKLNVNAEYNSGGKDPRSGFKVVYRLYGDAKVSVKTKTWGNHTDLKLDRIDIFKRQSDNVISINGNPQTINPGETYVIQNITWQPPGCGGHNYNSGITYLKIINDVCADYFNIEQYVWEYDEECDSAYAKIESYIEKK